VPQRNFLAGVRRVVEEGGDAYLLATPLKALADFIYAQRLDWRSVAPVLESLRVEEESLGELTPDAFDEVEAAYTPGRFVRYAGT